MTCLASLKGDFDMGCDRFRTMAFTAGRHGLRVALGTPPTEDECMIECGGFPLLSVVARTAIGVTCPGGLGKACMEILLWRSMTFGAWLSRYLLMSEDGILPVPVGVAGRALLLGQLGVSIFSLTPVAPQTGLPSGVIMVGKRDDASLPPVLRMAVQTPLPSLASVERDYRRLKLLFSLAFELSLGVTVAA